MRPGAEGLRIAPGATLSFDTYFNALFEHQWRRYTQAGALTLSLRLAGRAVLRIWRRTPTAGTTLLHEADIAGAARVTLPEDTPNFRQAGVLWFDLTAQGGETVLERAAWSTLDQGAAPARLGVVICTFDRAAPLAAVLATIAGDPGLDAVARVIVVSQGRPGLAADPGVARAAAALGPRLHLVEQQNLGGAGGFGRGLLEALDDPAISHVCFLDDDVRLEPESLRRMAAFFTLARADLALGGHMLDSVCPTALYEAGAVMRPNWELWPHHHGLDLRPAEALDSLLDPAAMHFNGWWMFGFPKAWVAQIGMPLPCFIRGDDVEFGLRLHAAGLATVALPGVAIWHEPFYLKIGGWQLYYETRNALLAASLHQDFIPRRVAWLLLRRLVVQLLTYRCYSAALIVRAIEDFAQGPAILDQDPLPLHARLTALRAQYPEARISRAVVVPEAGLARHPRTRLGTAWAMARAMARNWVSPSRPDAPPRRLSVQEQLWWRMHGTDCLAVDSYWEPDLLVIRRDRARFRALLVAGLCATWRLWRAAPALRQAWRDAAPRLTTVAFWRAYVRL